VTARIWRDASLWPTKTPSDEATSGGSRQTLARRAQVAAIALILLALFVAVLIFG
jgi:hypothetical protein